MAIETEVKAKGNNLTTIRRRLKKLGAKFISKKRQVDTYYLVLPKRSRYHKVPLLRIREDKTKNQSFWEYHEPVNVFKAREHEIEINNPAMAKLVLKKLDYPLGAVIDKIRERYTCEGLNIDLDWVKGLGQFIEVECMKNQKDSLKRIFAFFEKIGVAKKDLIPKERYVDIMWERQHKLKTKLRKF